MGIDRKSPGLAIFYVYILFDENAIPRYVGKGKGNRIQTTKLLTKRNHMKNTFLKRTLVALGEIPVIKIRDNLTQAQAFEIEIAFIAAIGRRKTHDGPLTNLSAGGDGYTSESAKALAKSYSVEKRLAINKAISIAALKYSPEERRARGLKRQIDLGPDRRKASALKAVETRFKTSTSEERQVAARTASLAVTSTLWINDGIKDRRIGTNDIVPLGWVRGRLNICADIVKISCINSRWINDGSRTKRLKPSEKLPDGWNYGRIYARALSPTTAPGTLPSTTMLT